MKKTYLNDGVYAQFDGYQIWLNDEDPDHPGIALELETLTELISYAARMWDLEINFKEKATK